MRQLDFCLCENKGADQLRSNCEADQRFCFRCSDSTIPLLLKYNISSLYPSSVTVQPGKCWTRSETQIVGFLKHRLIYKFNAICKGKADRHAHLNSLVRAPWVRSLAHIPVKQFVRLGWIKCTMM